MALTRERANPYINPSDFPGEEYQVAQNGSAWAGGLTGVNSAGYLNKIPGPSVNNAAYRVRGLSHTTWANNAPGNVNGQFKVRVDRPNIVQGLKILAGDPVTIADIGNTIYLEDDETIRRTSNTNTRCAGGILQKLNPDGTADIKLPQP